MRKNATVEQPQVVVKKGKLHKIYKDRALYILMLPALAVTFFFMYCPMPGLLMAFEDYTIYDGLLGSKWVGLENIKQIFKQKMMLDSIWNTLWISILNVLVCFPAPIVLALLINEIGNKFFKRFVQTASYLPHFLSWISVVGLIQILFGRDGLINDIRMQLGAAERITYLAEQKNFVPMIIWTSLWKGVGWGTIIHLANLTSINPELYEAADIDGANYFHKLWYITIPHMLPTVMILLIFQMGGLFSSNFELIWGLQNPFIDFEVISTVIYQTGLQAGNYSLSTAVGFMQGLIALLLVGMSNWFSKKVTGSGIF